MSRRSLPAVLLALLFLGNLAGQATFAQEVTRRLELSNKVGQMSRYRLAFDIDMRANISGQGEPDEHTRRLMKTLAEGMALRTALEYEQRLVEVAGDGVRTFEVHWRDYEFNGQLGGREIPPPAGYVESMRDLLSQTALVRTTPSGRTIDVTYAHPRLADLERGLEQMEGGMPTYLPDEPVAVGDSWTSTAEIPLGNLAGGVDGLTLELVHTLKEVRQGATGPVAVIELNGSYSQLQGPERTGLGVPMQVQASLTGVSTFDISEGRFTGGRFEIDMFALHAAGGLEVQLTGHGDGNLELLAAR